MGVTRGEYLQTLADGYETLARLYIKLKEVDLAIFYRNVSIGFSDRLKDLSLNECMRKLD